MGLVTIAHNEARFMPKFLSHIPDWVERKVVLVSTKPWNGEQEELDNTASLAGETGALVISNHWLSETAQRNTGQDLTNDCDWNIILDPDEFLSNEDWVKLKDFLKLTNADAVICQGQYTYWKDGWVADPPRDYQQLIAVRPHVKFVDKRVVGSSYTVAPVWVHHFSWARTDEEVWRKISHYSHRDDFDIKDWYENVWLKWKPGDEDAHPVTPETLHKFKKAELPKEIEELDLWPKPKKN